MTTIDGTAASTPVHAHGIHENLSQFVHQLVQVLLVGFAIGMMRTVVPALAETEFGVAKGRPPDGEGRGIDAAGAWRSPAGAGGDYRYFVLRADGRAGGERERKNDRHQAAGHAGE